jgi:hypothetical protein
MGILCLIYACFLRNTTSTKIKRKLPVSSLIFLHGLNPLPGTPPTTANVGNPSTIF